jgi:hypothetical protein
MWGRVITEVDPIIESHEESVGISTSPTWWDELIIRVQLRKRATHSFPMTPVLFFTSTRARVEDKRENVRASVVDFILQK